jgi:hypothetical protein
MPSLFLALILLIILIVFHLYYLRPVVVLSTVTATGARLREALPDLLAEPVVNTAVVKDVLTGQDHLTRVLVDVIKTDCARVLHFRP